MNVLFKNQTLKLLLQYCLYKLKKPPLPPNRFIIFGNGRSGSTLLVSLLNSSGQVYCDGEILNQPVPFPQLYVDLQASYCQTPVYGFKLLNYQIKKIQNISSPGLFLQELYASGYKFIYLTRNNRLYHALSQINAIQKKKFHHIQVQNKPKYEPIWVNVEDVISRMEESEATTNYYHEILEQIPHLSLTYEDDLQNSELHQQTANKVLKFLDLPTSPVTAGLVKLMPQGLTNMVKNYEELFDTLKSTKYAKFLDLN